jgi:hypothetical protein
VLLVVSVPLLWLSAVIELVAFRVSVPVSVRVVANVAVPLIVSGPVASVRGPPLSRLAMVWFALASVAMLIVEVTVLGIQTLSVEIGTAPLLQLPAVAH